MGKVGFTCSAFDLLHAGHILMLEEAKDVCDFLIVGLQTDPSIDRKKKNRPVQSLVERQIQLSGVSYVDDIIVYSTEEELLEILKTMPIDIRIVGADYIGKDFTGKDYCLKNNIEIYYNRRDHDYSSSNLINRIKNV
jgi:glycerol-3-phosphate cytidylyltransferase